MKHSIIFRREGVYGAFPILNHLPDGRLTIGFSLSDFHDHYALGKWTVLVSEDEGDSWTETEDPSIPATWPASNPREQSDRFARSHVRRLMGLRGSHWARGLADLPPRGGGGTGSEYPGPRGRRGRVRGEPADRVRAALHRLGPVLEPGRVGRAGVQRHGLLAACRPRRRDSAGAGVRQGSRRRRQGIRLERLRGRAQLAALPGRLARERGRVRGAGAGPGALPGTDRGKRVGAGTWCSSGRTTVG